MGISMTSYMGRYLGHHLLHKGRRSQGLGKLLERVRDKLDGWKARCLSRARRLTLAQSVLNGMDVFSMQTQRLPTWVHKELDKSVRRCVRF